MKNSKLLNLWLIGFVSVLFSTGAMAVPITTGDLGDLSGDVNLTGAIAGGSPGPVLWWSFTADGFTYLDISTNGSSLDTEIALYDAAGNLVGNDDDDGIGLDSTLSFGVGSGMVLGDVFNLGGDGIANGEDGPLAAGTYYLAFGEFNITFNATGFGAVSTGFDTGGNYNIDIFTDATDIFTDATVASVPEPGTLALLGLGFAGMGMTRRRRKI